MPSRRSFLMAAKAQNKAIKEAGDTKTFVKRK